MKQVMRTPITIKPPPTVHVHPVAVVRPPSLSPTRVAAPTATAPGVTGLARPDFNMAPTPTARPSAPSLNPNQRILMELNRRLAKKDRKL